MIGRIGLIGLIDDRSDLLSGWLAEVGVFFANNISRPSEPHAYAMKQLGRNDSSENLEHWSVERFPVFVPCRTVLPTVAFNSRNPLDPPS
jgi:hypothetical protein